MRQCIAHCIAFFAGIHLSVFVYIANGAKITAKYVFTVIRFPLHALFRKSHRIETICSITYLITVRIRRHIADFIGL